MAIESRTRSTAAPPKIVPDPPAFRPTDTVSVIVEAGFAYNPCPAVLPNAKLSTLVAENESAVVVPIKMLSSVLVPAACHSDTAL